MERKQIQTQKKTKKSIFREAGEIALAFIVAWLGYQALSLATGTALPIVAVVSDSMYHTQSHNAWWNEVAPTQFKTRGGFYENIGIGKEQFKKFPMKNGLARGDLLLVVGGEPQTGDVIIYDKSEQNKSVTIVHRLVGVTNGEYITKGDNNYAADQPVAKSQIKGKVVGAVPMLGYPRYLLFIFGI